MNGKSTSGAGHRIAGVAGWPRGLAGAARPPGRERGKSGGENAEGEAKAARRRRRGRRVKRGRSPEHKTRRETQGRP